MFISGNNYNVLIKTKYTQIEKILKIVEGMPVKKVYTLISKLQI
jgi:hypothetical protein